MGSHIDHSVQLRMYGTQTEVLTALTSRLSITDISIGLKLLGPVVKPRPLKYQHVIPGNKTTATRRRAPLMSKLVQTWQGVGKCNDNIHSFKESMMNMIFY